jgi:hypothetical protein
MSSSFSVGPFSLFVVCSFGLPPHSWGGLSPVLAMGAQYFIFYCGILSFDLKLQLHPEYVMADGRNGTQVLSSVEDSVVFMHDNVSIIGRKVKVHGSNKESVAIFKNVTPEMLLHYSLPTITVGTSPLAMKSSMAELFHTAEVWKIYRSAITDLAFIIPLYEVESGLFHLSGAQNTYFIRYKFNSIGNIEDYCHSMLEPRIAELLSHRIFRGLNMLSSSIKKYFIINPRDSL